MNDRLQNAYETVQALEESQVKSNRGSFIKEEGTYSEDKLEEGENVDLEAME